MIKRYSRDPAWVRIEAHAANAPQVEQIFFEVDRRSKGEALTRLIDVHDFRYGIIFCSTKVMVDELDEQLHSRGYAVDRLHGDLSQMQRDRVMEKFRRRGFEFLIATDVAARGLDVDDLEVVFNYDLPNDAEDYTHRIGRTGRAGKTGVAMTFVCGREIYKLQSMAHYARLKIARGRIPSLDEVEEAKEEAFVEKLRRVLEAKQFRSHDRIVDSLLEQGYASTDIASALIHMLQGGGAEPAAAAAPTAAKPAAVAPAVKPPPVWVAAAKAEKVERVAPSTLKAPAPVAKPELRSDNVAATSTRSAPEAPREGKPKKRGYERKPRTGREPGYTTLSFNVGAQQQVTPADLVGKIAGVTRLPATIVGAIDIYEAHAHVDVAAEVAETVAKKLAGIRLKDVALHPAAVPPQS
jgi:ATP-dependent RNA helicase DeaD